MPDDYSADRFTTGTVAVGSSTTGTIETAYDEDWFAVELVAGRTYQFDLEGSPTGRGTLPDTYLRAIYDSEGRYQSGTYNDNFDGSKNSRVTFTAEESGTYYVRASGDRDEVGHYTLSVRDMTPPEAGNPPPADPPAADPPADTAAVAAESETDQGQGAQASVSEGATDLPNDNSTPGRVAVGGSATGTIGTARDNDRFAVELVAGRTYQFDLEGSPGGGGTLPDTYFRAIYNSDGRYQSGSYNDNFDGSRDSRVTFTAQESGTYYARVSGDRNETGTYTLTVTDMTAPETDGSTTDPVTPEPQEPTVEFVGPDQDAPQQPETSQAQDEQVSVSEGATDLPAGPATTGRVVVGGSATGTIGWAGDRDWIKVDLEAGKTYRFDLKGSATNDGTLADPYLHGIHDAGGQPIAGTTDDDSGAGNNSRVYFTPTEDATWYVAAGAYGTHGYAYQGTYTLSVTEVTDDYAAGPATAGTVAVGGSVEGRIEPSGDEDWFAVELEADKTYRLDLKGSATSDGTLADPYLRGIHDADGDRIANTTNDGGGVWPNSRVYFTSGEAGTYYVAAGAGQGHAGTYTLSVTETPDDYAAGTDTTGTVVVGGSVEGSIEPPGDEDWFAVVLEAGKSYRFDLKGSRTNDGTLSDPYLRGIHDAAGERIANTTNNDGGEGRNSRVYFTPAEAATYYVAAGADRNAYTGTYTLSVTEVTDDYAAEPDPATTGTVEVGGSVESSIEPPGDEDWFKVVLEAGKIYRFDLKGSPTNDGTLSDPYLRGIHDAAGKRIAGTTDDDGGEGRNSRVYFTPAEAATYYVAAGADRNAYTGTYTLSVTEVDVFPVSHTDLPADTTTPGRVLVGGSATETIGWAGDRDWIRVDLEAGKTYRLDLKGSATNDGTLADPYLHGIHDAGGQPIAGTTDDDSGAGNNSRVYFTPTEDAAWYVAAGAYGTHGYAYQGTYTLSVEEVTDDYAAEPDPATTGTVAVGGSAEGSIEPPGDEDWFAVALEAGKTYRFDLEGSRTNDGTLADPYLRGIYDADGERIADTADDNGGEGRNSRVYFAPDEAATWYVAAGAGQGHAGAYTLSVTDVTDDYAAEPDPATTGTVAVGGSVEGSIEPPGDEDWFAVELEAGKPYRFDLKGSRTNDGTLHDPYLRGIYDAGGERIADTTNDDGGRGRNSRVYFTPDEDATYYVAALAGDVHDIGTYTLSVTEVTDDYAAEPDPATTGTVEVGGSVEGSIEPPRDEDWFAVELEAGTTYRFDLKGSRTNDGTLSDPYLRGIHDAAGERIANTTNNDGGEGRNSRVYFTPDEDATYYVAAGGYSDFAGTYTLSATEVDVFSEGATDLPANTSTPGRVLVGGSATGTIGRAGDEDWFAVELEAGKTYQVDLQGLITGDGTLFDPYLRGIHDAGGKRIANTTDDDGGVWPNSRVYFTPDEGGAWYVAAGAFGNRGGTYTLSVDEVVDGL